MHATQPTAAARPRQDPFRWSHADIRDALDAFSDPQRPSQRHCAEQRGIPQATFNYWTRHYAPDPDDPVDGFFRSAGGAAVLRRILLAALTTFQLEGACGIRKVGTFLDRAGLDRFVASSRGALQPLAAWLEADLVAFRDIEQPALAQQMKSKTITLIADEHFHSHKPCLVGLEPVADFILVECYRDHRDADSWKEAIDEGTAGMNIEVVQMTSDLARALVCCAEKGLQAAHSPDLFHGQRDLLKPLLLPLHRPIQQAEKDLEKAKERCHERDSPLDEPATQAEWLALIEAVQQEQDSAARLEAARQRQEQALAGVRGVADDYHPFDRQTGQPVTAAEVGQRLSKHVDHLQEVVAGAGLGQKAQAALDKSRNWVGTLVGCVAWFWCLANARVQELDLSPEQEQAVREQLLPGHYWDMAAGRARTAPERRRLKDMAQQQQQQAWQAGGALASLPEQERKEVQEATHAIAGLFQRSSSCVEGRNGRLSLQHHGHSRVSQQRLAALTVIHNYMVQRPDGTTAAERFFGQKHSDAFSWLLQRMPDLPRPAAKRKRAAQDAPVAGSR